MYTHTYICTFIYTYRYNEKVDLPSSVCRRDAEVGSGNRARIATMARMVADCLVVSSTGTPSAPHHTCTITTTNTSYQL